jgi:hypothetical protein
MAASRGAIWSVRCASAIGPMGAGPEGECGLAWHLLSVSQDRSSFTTAEPEGIERHGFDSVRRNGVLLLKLVRASERFRISFATDISLSRKACRASGVQDRRDNAASATSWAIASVTHRGH